MEQILAFVLGVGAVAFIWAVVVAFKTTKKVKEIEQTITGQQSWILRNDEFVNRRIDEEVTRVNTIYDNCIKYTDSRVDKLEHKYIDQTQSKKLING